MKTLSLLSFLVLIVVIRTAEPDPPPLSAEVLAKANELAENTSGNEQTGKVDAPKEPVVERKIDLFLE